MHAGCMLLSAISIVSVELFTVMINQRHALFMLLERNWFTLLGLKFILDVVYKDGCFVPKASIPIIRIALGKFFSDTEFR